MIESFPALSFSFDDEHTKDFVQFDFYYFSLEIINIDCISWFC